MIGENKEKLVQQNRKYFKAQLSIAPCDTSHGDQSHLNQVQWRSQDLPQGGGANHFQ